MLDYTTAADTLADALHMVMGFELPESTDSELSGLAELMLGCEYLGADEVSRIPTVKSARAGIVYGPLRDFPVRADLIVMCVSARDAMLYAEAAGGCAWTMSAPGGPLGRPACAALPTALQNASPLLSLGCAGMRTFTEISDHRLMAVLPAQELDTFVAGVSKTVEANSTMQRAYDARRMILSLTTTFPKDTRCTCAPATRSSPFFGRAVAHQC